MVETIVYGIFTLCGAIIGAIIGGIIALKICDKTIRNENKNNLDTEKVKEEISILKKLNHEKKKILDVDSRHHSANMFCTN